MVSEIRRDRDTFGGSRRFTESAGARIRFVDPSPSVLYSNITTFGESGLFEARSERAINACVYCTSKITVFVYIVYVVPYWIISRK